MTISRKNLDGLAETLSQDEAIGPCHVEHDNGRYTLISEGGHRRELLYGRTKRELFDLMHAMALGMRIARAFRDLSDERDRAARKLEYLEEQMSREAHPAGKGAYSDRGSDHL